MNRRRYLAAVGVGLGNLAGCITFGGGSDDSSKEPIETTFEGDGSALKELEVEREGAIFFTLEASDGIDVSIIPADESRNQDRVGVSEDLPMGKFHADIEPGEHALDIEASGNWTIQVEQNPELRSDDVEEPDYPIEISGNYHNVFGPYYFDGFRSFTISSNVLMAVRFIDGEGELLERRRYDGTNDDGESERNPLNFESVCWIETPVGGPEWRRPDVMEYRLTIDVPD